MRRIARALCVPLALLVLALAAAAAAQESADGEVGRLESPRWSYEIRAGNYEPDLPAFAAFYGDDREDYFAVAGSYRFTDWLEVGGEYGRMRASGSGYLTSSQAPGGAVTYRLSPVHVYSNFILQRSSGQRVVPYLGLGIVAAAYEQDVANQGASDGTSDLGYSARLGVRFLVGVSGSREAATRIGTSYWRSFVFLEAQEVSTKVDGFELGGAAYLLGFRMEFDFSGG